MEPQAYGLLALKPWEWEELQVRCTVGEIDEVVLGARWRAARAMDRLAWQTAHLLNAAGSKPESGGHWTAERLLGRPLMHDDPHGPRPLTEEEEAREAEAQEKALRASAILAEHEQRMSER